MSGRGEHVCGAGGLEVRASAVHGRGVFALRGFRAGDLVELCPVLVLPAADRPPVDGTLLYEYYFNWEGGAVGIALGYGTLYNHAAEPLARYRKDFAASALHITAVADIPAGTEITVDYTDGGINRLWFTPRT
ncbi:SET domain-containing protein-lysine N-methyltransferase [Nocardiopsis potens]|uniref:SET domain-containing protein-lysine N-methyltransferase n=1 Tax=Nocardiopsis potens TaxID=1246458 RepID=UPI00034D487A|nr:SET domain-containing protein-lysine N-methyltransferase [Nocardiopsis potens]